MRSAHASCRAERPKQCCEWHRTAQPADQQSILPARTHASSRHSPRPPASSTPWLLRHPATLGQCVKRTNARERACKRSWQCMHTHIEHGCMQATLTANVQAQEHCSSHSCMWLRNTTMPSCCKLPFSTKQSSTSTAKYAYLELPADVHLAKSGRQAQL